MRAFSRGEHFLDIRAESFLPCCDGEEKPDTKKHGMPPVFSEGFLYHVMSKDDARFVLAVGEEYANIVNLLGPDKVNELLEGDGVLDRHDLRRIAARQRLETTNGT